LTTSATNSTTGVEAAAHLKRQTARPTRSIPVCVRKVVKMAKTPTDPLRVNLLELTEEIADHTSQLRDFATTPGNAWLAKGELQALMGLLSDMETLLEEIKQADHEAGY
jgi:hypothetical protein